MSSQATSNTSLQWTPPNAAPNSGNVLYSVVANYNAQNVGQIDILPTQTPPLPFSIPFGSVTQCLMLVIKNSQATDIGVLLNGGVALGGLAASVNVSLGIVTVSGLTNVPPEAAGDTVTIVGAATSANNGTFPIATVVNSSTVTITNSSAVTDANNAHIAWQISQPQDNFRLPPGGVFMFSAPVNPINEYITSASIVSYGVPGAGNVETVSYYCFGN